MPENSPGHDKDVPVYRSDASKSGHDGPDLRREARAGGDVPHHQQVESYGGGHIEARHGRVNLWLAVVYLVMFVWAIYYGFKYWGGLGPGLDY